MHHDETKILSGLEDPNIATRDRLHVDLASFDTAWNPKPKGKEIIGPASLTYKRVDGKITVRVSHD